MTDNLNKPDNTVKPHTIKKFELIKKYVEVWAQKLLNIEKCEQIVFIDCMCNHGVYTADDGSPVYGTPVRISKLISEIMKSYPEKQAVLYFNDSSEDKIKILESHIPDNTINFKIKTSVSDGNALLHELSKKLNITSRTHYLLVYDPYKADIDWSAISPFLKNWGEVIINHMVSDSIRGISQARKKEVVKKYEKTYDEDIDSLLALGNDKKAFEQRIHEIIKTFDKECYISSYPFFNTKNGLVYYLIHCTSNFIGFNLYKTTAWKTFGGKSSIKKTHGLEDQRSFDFEGESSHIIPCDEDCYNINDIAEYLSTELKGEENIPFEKVYDHLKYHPIFPCDGFKDKIKHELKENYGVVIHNNAMSFP